MLKNKTKIITLFLVLILLFSATFVFADNETADDGIMPISEEPSETMNPNARVDENNYKKSDVYLAGESVTIDYIVDGNLFVFADTVTINSQIGGDAFIFAKNVIIDEQGYVFSNLFTVSENIEIKGVVYDVYAISKTINISKGYVYRDMKISCETLNVNGVIGRNAFVGCSNINFNTDGESNGTIYGDLNYTASSEFSIPENVVSGKVNYTPLKLSVEKPVQSIIADYIWSIGTFIAFVLIIWLVCLGIAPKFLNNTNNYVGKKTLSVLGYGLLTLIIVPIACVILILLRLTSAFSLFLLALYILALIISKCLFTITANNYLCSKLKINKNIGIFGMLIVSGIIIDVITMLPYVGGYISFVITVLGLGILIISILPKRTAKSNEDNLVDNNIVEKTEDTKDNNDNNDNNRTNNDKK